MSRFRNCILDKHLKDVNDSHNELIIIDRKHNRKFDKDLVDSLVNEAKKETAWVYKGIVLLEDLTFSEQVNLFHRTKYFILRHGSSIVNLLWSKCNSIVFEIYGGHEGNYMPNVMRRLSMATKFKHIAINYNTAKTSNIFDTIISLV